MALEKTITEIENRTLRRAAIAAGIAYLFALVQGFALAFPANSILFVSGNRAATATNIAAHELLYRITLLNEIVMYVSVIVLAVALYVIVKTVNKNLALLGLSLRLAEAILSVVSVLAGFVVLEFLNGDLTAFKTEQLQALVQTFLNVHTAGSRIGLVFTALGSIIFYFLFLRSKYIPRILAGFGILSYLVMLAAVIVDMLTPGASTKTLQTSVLEFAPVIVFEAIVGLWLLIKGVKVRPPDTGALESA